MPNKIRLRDLDPDLIALISGKDVTEGQLNNVLSKYRKKDDIITEQDIDIAYRNMLSQSIENIKAKLEEHLSKILSIGENDLAPDFLQRIKNIETKIEALNKDSGEGEGSSSEPQDYSADIQKLQTAIDSIEATLKTLDVDTVSAKLNDAINAFDTIKDEAKTAKQAVDGYEERFNSMEEAIAGKRDKDSVVTEEELSPDIISKLGNCDEISNKFNELSVSVAEQIEQKRSIDTPIAEEDLDNSIVEKLNSISGIDSLVQNLPSQFEASLEGKRDKSESITEEDLDDALKEKVSLGESADSRISNIESRMNKFPAVEPGDYLTTADSFGNIEGKSLFSYFYTIKTAEDLAVLNDNKKAKYVLNTSTGECYVREYVGTEAPEESPDEPIENPPDDQTENNGDNKSEENQSSSEEPTNDEAEPSNPSETEEVPEKTDETVLVLKENFFETHTECWNTFVVDASTNRIIAYVLKNGILMYFYGNQRDKKEIALSLNAEDDKTFECQNAMSIPLKILANDGNQKYVSAEHLVTVTYDTNAYTVKNETEEKLDLIIIEG